MLTPYLAPQVSRHPEDPTAPPPTKRPRGRPPKNRHLSPKPKPSSSSSITKKRRRLKLLSPTRPSKSFFTPSITSTHSNGIGSSLTTNNTTSGGDVSRGGHHQLRNRAAIQRPVYFRDSFFALEEAIAYSKLQKHKERKRKIHRQPAANASLQSSQKQSTPNPTISQNHTPTHPLQPAICTNAEPCDTKTKQNPDDTPSVPSVPNLDKYMIEEKSFMDLLVCFMRMRNTPIRNVPKLGSKKCMCSLLDNC